MKTKILAMCLTIILSGCSLMNQGPGQRSPEDWKKMAPLMKSRVKYVAAFAFTMNSVKPHKAGICAFAAQLGNFLESYDDQDANFEKLQAAVMAFLIQIEDPAVRDAATIIVDMVLTEAYNYAWQHYKGFIDQDPAQVALIIAAAVADGLRDACGLNLSTMGVQDSPQGIFTTRS